MNQLTDVLNRPESAMAIVISDQPSDSDIADMAAINPRPIIELRVDLLASYEADDLEEQVQELGGFAVIATVRHKDEGGKWEGSEPERCQGRRAGGGGDRPIGSERSNAHPARFATARKPIA